MNGSSNGYVTSTDNLSRGGGFSQTNNYVIEGRIDRSTQSQLANKVRRETVTAAARFA